MSRVRLAVLISGRGSNMDAILEACAQEGYPARAELVVSNRPGAGGLARASARNIPTHTIDHKLFGADREAFERRLHDAFQAANIELIALAGFMRILTPWFVGRWAGRLINIHPSLLPKYPGLDTHQRALDAGDNEHGCSVHWVTEGVDQGAVIAQARVPVLADDTPETLNARVLPEEHTLYPLAIMRACKTLRHA